MSDITRILSQVEQGNSSASEQLLLMVYDELRKLASHKLANEKPGQTLQATALVHEAYLRLVDVDQAQHWNSRGHFFAAAAEAMRRILVESARRKQRLRHGGQSRRLALHPTITDEEKADNEILDLDEVLEDLSNEDPLAAELVKLRYFAGLTIKETAVVLAISTATANRRWAFAKAWLYQRLHD